MDPCGRAILDEGGGLGHRGKDAVVPVHLRGAGAEGHPDVDDRNPIGPCRCRRSGDRGEEWLLHPGEPLDDGGLEVHEQQCGIGHADH